MVSAQGLSGSPATWRCHAKLNRRSAQLDIHYVDVLGRVSGRIMGERYTDVGVRLRVEDWIVRSTNPARGGHRAEQKDRQRDASVSKMADYNHGFRGNIIHFHRRVSAESKRGGVTFVRSLNRVWLSH